MARVGDAAATPEPFVALARWVSRVGHPFVLVLVVLGVRRSAYSDHDVSDRAQRSGFYRAVFVVLPIEDRLARLGLTAP